jgi:3-oxoacyl-[acyl-carrier protein] reductase
MTEVASRPTAIITGGGSGIGAACARRFARAGHNVVVNFARNADGAKAVADECRGIGVEALAVGGDIASDQDCRTVADAALEAWGRIDVLVNNAGTTHFADPSDLDALGAEHFARIFGVNVIGTYQMVRAVWSHLRRAPNAAIVNVSSHSGFSGSGSSIAYAASKGALNTLTLGLARALAPHARVNAVCPGFVDTAWGLAWQTEEQYAAFKTRIADIAPLKRVPDPEDVADAVMWLADARCVTGQLLVIDSGTHLTVGSPIGTATEA